MLDDPLFSVVGERPIRERVGVVAAPVRPVQAPAVGRQRIRGVRVWVRRPHPVAEVDDDVRVVHGLPDGRLVGVGGVRTRDLRAAFLGGLRRGLGQADVDRGQLLADRADDDRDPRGRLGGRRRAWGDRGYRRRSRAGWRGQGPSANGTPPALGTTGEISRAVASHRCPRARNTISDQDGRRQAPAGSGRAVIVWLSPESRASAMTSAQAE